MATADVEASCVARGWASQNGGTTDGGTATPTVVTTYDQLKAAITNAAVKVVQVNGTIAIPSGGRISFQDRTGKTLFGSAGARLTSADQTAAGSGILYVKRCSNVVIRNLILTGPAPTTWTGRTTAPSTPAPICGWTTASFATASTATWTLVEQVVSHIQGLVAVAQRFGGIRDACGAGCHGNGFAQIQLGGDTRGDVNTRLVK